MKVIECNDIPVATEREALERATLDYLAALDTVIEVDEIGCAGDWESFDQPIRVRVIKTDNEDVYHWNYGVDDYLDPYWNVVLVDTHPAFPPEAHLYIHAPRSYYVTSAGDRGSE